MNPIGFILCLIIFQTIVVLSAVKAFNSDSTKKEEARRPVPVESLGAMPGEKLQQLASVEVPATPVVQHAERDETMLPPLREATLTNESGEYLPLEDDRSAGHMEKLASFASSDIELDSVVLNLEHVIEAFSEGEQLPLQLDTTAFDFESA